MSATAVMHPRTHHADVGSVKAMLKARPVWAELAPASITMELPDKIILHAGPPVGREISAPIRNSAAMAILYEGWAENEADAFTMIDRGGVNLRPAQDFNAVVPLAAVLTRNMLTHVVVDRMSPVRRIYAPINGGSGPAMRLGKAGPEVVKHLRWINRELGQMLGKALVRDVPLVSIANEALARGDDLHGRTAAATDILCRTLFGGQTLIPFLRESPSLFLNLWMAACKCIVMAGSEVPGSSAVIAIGGNGREFGIKVAGIPDRWFTIAAQPPDGALENGYQPDDRLGAIGDSAIVDAQGFGAMAMHCAPAQESVLAAYMPMLSRDLGRAVMNTDDPRFLDGSTIRSGLLASHVANADATLAIALGILDRSGRNGRIGGGIYVTPRELFAAASRALQGLN